MIARRQRPFLPEDDPDLVEPAAAGVQLRPRDRGAAAAAGALSETEINGLVLRVGFVGDANTSGTPFNGGEICPSVVTRRIRPGRSVTSIRPSGRNASDQGLTSPLATVWTSSWPAEDANEEFSPRVLVAIRSDTDSRIAAVSAEATSTTGAFIVTRWRC
jgi:hypothetical protein